MNIAIIGAGYAGMAAAYDLAQAGHHVTILEAAKHVGGLAAGFKEPHWDWSVEKYYHHWFQTDAHMLGLIDELKLGSKVRFPRPYTVVFHQDKFYPLDSISQALLFPGLGYGVNKLRFGLVVLFLRITNSWQPLEKYTVVEWMRKWVGDQVYETMWQPLLDGKFGPYAHEVNMAWLWARLHARTTRLGTYAGGFQAFADDFEAILKRMGVKILLETRVEEIRMKPQVPVLEVRNSDLPEQARVFDQVLFTGAPALLATLAPELPKDYLKGLLDLKSMGAVVMTLSLRRQLSEQGYYWYNIPKSAGFPFLALVEHTNYLSPEQFGGDHIIYCGDYLEADHEYFSMTDNELLERFIPGILRINPGFRRDWINKIWVSKTNYAQPVPLLHHSQNIPAIRTPLAGLYFASMSQVYPWDRGTNFAVEIGRRAAHVMLE